MGDWTTKSFGKALDFNLMIAKGYRGSLKALIIEAGEQIQITPKKNDEEQITNIFYVVNGSLELSFNNNKFVINKSDLFYKTSSFSEKEFILSLSNKSKK